MIMSGHETKGLLRIVASRIRALRKAAAFSQEELSERADISPQYLSRLENGRQVPSMSIIVDLARALGTTPSELLAEAEPKKDPQAERISRLTALFGTLSEENAAFLESQLGVWMAHMRKHP